jgi:hypothetical protein
MPRPFGSSSGFKGDKNKAPGSHGLPKTNKSTSNPPISGRRAANLATRGHTTASTRFRNEVKK